MSYSRKGAMQLSLETIILLIVGLVVLGVLLAFVTGMFSKVDIPGLFPPQECKTNAENPILPTDVEINAGKSGLSLDMCVYNPQLTELKNAKVVLGSCIGTVPGEQVPIRISSVSSTLPSRKNFGYKLLVDTSLAKNVGTYVCDISVQGDGGSIGPTQISIKLK